jgi:hypothetical protein
MPLAVPFAIVSGPVIAAGESLSSVLDVSNANFGIKRITMPDDWTPAWLTFQISQDGVTFTDLVFADGSPVVVKVIPGTTVVAINDIWQAGYFRFRSGRRIADIVQAETRNFICVIN